jgi:hypothetical protein
MPTAAAAFSMGTGEADADEDALAGGVEDAGDDADHFTVGRDERPARSCQGWPQRRTE